MTEENNVDVRSSVSSPQEMFMSLWETITALEIEFRTKLSNKDIDNELLTNFCSIVIVLWHRLKFKVPEEMREEYNKYHKYYIDQGLVDKKPEVLLEMVDKIGEVMEALKMFDFDSYE